MVARSCVASDVIRTCLQTKARPTVLIVVAVAMQDERQEAELKKDDDEEGEDLCKCCLLYTSPSPRD